MKDLVKNLVALQDLDSRILEKRQFIDKVPMRIFEVDEPLKLAKLELDKMKQKNEVLAGKKRDRERVLGEITEKIKKMQARASELKTNKEYQAHLKEIESFQKEISRVEEEILVVMEELDNSLKLQKEKEQKVNAEVEKLDAFKKQLDLEVEQYEKELSSLKEERTRVAGLIEPEVYDTYMLVLSSGSGLAVTCAKNEICCGCNMNIPPQLFVEIRKNEEIIRCPQCRRILYYAEE